MKSICSSREFKQLIVDHNLIEDWEHFIISDFLLDIQLLFKLKGLLHDLRQVRVLDLLNDLVLCFEVRGEESLEKLQVLNRLDKLLLILPLHDLGVALVDFFAN